MCIYIIYVYINMTLQSHCSPECDCSWGCSTHVSPQWCLPWSCAPLPDLCPMHQMARSSFPRVSFLGFVSVCWTGGFKFLPKSPGSNTGRCWRTCQSRWPHGLTHYLAASALVQQHRCSSKEYAGIQAWLALGIIGVISYFTLWNTAFNSFCRVQGHLQDSTVLVTTTGHLLNIINLNLLFL